MKIKVKLSLEDYRGWNLEHFYGGLRGKLLVVISVCLIAVTVYYIKVMGLENLSRNPQIIFIISLGLLFLFMMPVSIFYQSKNVFLRDKLLQEEMEYDLRDNGFKVSSESGTTEVGAEQVFKVRISGKFASIYMSPIRAFVVPVRFLDEGAIKEIKAYGKKTRKKTEI